MSPDFSQQLIDRLIQYVEKNYGLIISNEQADEFLDSMGELNLCISKLAERRTRPAGRGRTP